MKRSLPPSLFIAILGCKISGLVSNCTTGLNWLNKYIYFLNILYEHKYINNIFYTCISCELQTSSKKHQQQLLQRKHNYSNNLSIPNPLAQQDQRNRSLAKEFLGTIQEIRTRCESPHLEITEITLEEWKRFFLFTGLEIKLSMSLFDSLLPKSLMRKVAKRKSSHAFMHMHIHYK